MPSQVPFYTIEQTVNTYKYLFKPNPTFGMDFFADDFVAKDVILLEDDKAPSHGIPLRFDYYALFLRLKGETKRTVNQYCYQIKPRALQLVCPGSIYSFQDTTDTSKTYVLLFDKNFLEEQNLTSETLSPLLRFHESHPQDVILEPTAYLRTMAIYEQLSEELRAKNSGYLSVCKMLINQLLFLLQREKEKNSVTTAQTRAEQICSDFLVLIEENFYKLKHVKDYASLLGITPKHLSETVQQTLHHNALFYIHLRLIKEIQYLLCFSELSIKQITHILNFETPSQLGRFFKHAEGMSPKEYRMTKRFFKQEQDNESIQTKDARSNSRGFEKSLTA